MSCSGSALDENFVQESEPLSRVTKKVKTRYDIGDEVVEMESTNEDLANLMAALLVTFLFVALEENTLGHSYGPRKTLAIGFDMRLEGSRKINAGRECDIGHASLDSDNKGYDLEGFRFRTRGLSSRRRPPPPPAPMENRHRITAKAFIAAATPSIVMKDDMS
ncbi:unnamed protein product [Lupinus luteus]|uniref:Uncharacterized protein n=1 Tax=Lupinus luteus TaxID=3873 RepID=A0AAV1Y833_LUPLU